jgi:5-deoxy-glucuronate isomerase
MGPGPPVKPFKTSGGKVVQSLVSAGDQTELINLELVDLANKESWESASSLEVVAVILSGQIDVAIDGRDLGQAGGRRSVFEGPGHAVYVPPDAVARLVARGGSAELAVVSSQPGTSIPGTARVIAPEDQRIANVGKGNWSRSVRTMLGPEHAASRLLVGETINPPGNWSSYPPHKHDVQARPDEVRLEEVYLFKVEPREGFGVQVRYDEDGNEEAFLVRDGEAAVIPSGYHPVVAAPGYALYYLWAMAGEGRELIPHFDARFAWIQDH